MPKTISPVVKDLYKQTPIPHRKTMLAIRTSILQIIPDAVEVVSYGMPLSKTLLKKLIKARINFKK